MDRSSYKWTIYPGSKELDGGPCWIYTRHAPRAVRPVCGGISGRTGFAATQDLDGRAREDCVAESDVRLGDLHPDGLYRRVIFQDRGGYPLGDRLGQVDGRALDDLSRPPVHLAVVYGPR